MNKLIAISEKNLYEILRDNYPEICSKLWGIPLVSIDGKIKLEDFNPSGLSLHQYYVVIWGDHITHNSDAEYHGPMTASEAKYYRENVVFYNE